MQQSIGMLHERVQILERRLEGYDSSAKKGADLYSRMDEVQMRVGALSGRIDELEHKLDQVVRLASTPPPPPPQPLTPSQGINIPETPQQAPAAPQAAAPPPPPPAQTAKATAPPLPPAPPPPERENPEKVLYDKATQLFQQGQFEQARKEFQSFLSKYPKSGLADNALYSVGECYMAEKKYQDSIEAFQQLLDRYPSGNKVPHALLKQGTAFQQLGDATAARILYERLVDKYPDTPQAQAAQKKLKQMP